MSQDPDVLTNSTKKRGRPRLTAQDLQFNQAHVLQSMARLLRQYPIHQLSVEQLIADAHVSRPSFYRWFPQGLDQALEQLIDQVNQILIQRIVLAVRAGHTPEERIAQAIRTYFDWMFEYMNVVKGIYRAAFDESSIPYQYRRRSIDQAIDIIRVQAHALGMHQVTDVMIETLILWIETSGLTALRYADGDQQILDDQCQLTTEVMILLFLSMKNRQQLA